MNWFQIMNDYLCRTKDRTKEQFFKNFLGVRIKCRCSKMWTFLRPSFTHDIKQWKTGCSVIFQIKGKLTVGIIWLSIRNFDFLAKVLEHFLATSWEFHLFPKPHFECKSLPKWTTQPANGQRVPSWFTFYAANLFIPCHIWIQEQI